MKNEKTYIPYSAKRWTEIPMPESTGAVRTVTEDQRKQYDKDMENIMKEYGILKPEESL